MICRKQCLYEENRQPYVQSTKPAEAKTMLKSNARGPKIDYFAESESWAHLISEAY